mmetsp:Transcript_25792/g.72212  ORF Transcript_25792/g.72212 Transcript_25792/m.72212 type:complete len:949 (+) Transcript_25792:177-3023(+)|eukprot:CAMPEP_0117657496 /NCGR_PEP_ID=MMETSP0804-20121206/5362_1 /TAXON_ID=1074897 /ORGANISM="Tetraselmis astigmatica, Strain CCMP880" /LENGTH=948 /DNA_ID=CAMNT_0005463955 /DNA_START=122 /DNA_END=2968 /DNA_ORIENTATION=-
MAGTACTVNIALDGQAPSGEVAWDRVSNLVAVALQPVGRHEAHIVVVEPSDASSHFTLRVPLGTPGDTPKPASPDQLNGVRFMEWSPVGAPRVLLVLTHCGKLFGFRQPRKGPTELKSISEWQGKPIMTMSSGEHLVALKWLEPTSMWSWPGRRGPSQQQHSVHSLFVTPKDPLLPKTDVKFTDHVLHWVRPGLLSCMAVMSNGHVRIWTCILSGKEFHWPERKTSVAGFGDNIVTLADIVTGPQQTVRMALVKKGDAKNVLVFEMRGDPTGESSGKTCNKLTVAKVAVVHMTTQAMGANLIGVHFDPTKKGRAFMCLLDDKVGGALQLLSYRQKGRINFEAAGMMRLSLSGLSGSPAAAMPSPGPANRKLMSCMRMSNDGCLMAIVLAQAPHSLHLIRTGVLKSVCETVRLMETGAGQLSAAGLAFSPSGTCLAVASTTQASNGSLPRLQILALVDYSRVSTSQEHSSEATVSDEEWKKQLAEQMSPITQAELAADRILWCMLHNHHHWDTVTRVRMLSQVPAPDPAAAPAPQSQRTALQRTVSIVDSAIHAQPRVSRALFSSQWDCIKIPILVHETDPIARAVVIDIQTRQFLNFLETTFKSFFHHEDFQDFIIRMKSQDQQSQDQRDVAALKPWVDWMVDFCYFFLTNNMRWVQRNKENATMPGRKHGEAADNLPSARLICDQSFLKSMTTTLVFTAYMATEHDKSEKLRRMIEMMKKIAQKSPLTNPLTAGEDPDKIGAEVQYAKESMEAFKGNYHLHYAWTSGAITWQVLCEVVPDSATVQQLHENDDEMIHRAARVLGLLPTLECNAMCASNLFPGVVLPPCVPHNEAPRFVLPEEPPAGEAASISAAVTLMHRKRWRSERDKALGIMHGMTPGGGSTMWVRDSITAAMPANRPPLTHECLETNYSTAGALPPEATDNIAELLGSCSSMCSLTGGRWKRLKD